MLFLRQSQGHFVGPQDSEGSTQEEREGDDSKWKPYTQMGKGCVCIQVLVSVSSLVGQGREWLRRQSWDSSVEGLEWQYSMWAIEGKKQFLIREESKALAASMGPDARCSVNVRWNDLCGEGQG